MNEEGEKADGEARPLSPLLANTSVSHRCYCSQFQMSQEAQIFAVHETCQSVKEKYPGLKHKGDSDFTLNPHEAFQGCHFSAVRGTGLRSRWEPRRASLRATRPPPPVFH